MPCARGFSGKEASVSFSPPRFAYFYGLTESEFTHISGTFPLVDPGVRAAAHLL